MIIIAVILIYRSIKRSTFTIAAEGSIPTSTMIFQIGIVITFMILHSDHSCRVHGAVDKGTITGIFTYKSKSLANHTKILKEKEQEKFGAAMFNIQTPICMYLTIQSQFFKQMSKQKYIFT